MDLGPEGLRDRVAVWDPNAVVQSWDRQQAGKVNTTYRIELKDRAAVGLRLFARDADGCRRDEALFERIGAAVPVPQLLHTAPTVDPPWALYRWIDGWKLDALLESRPFEEVAGAARAVGRTLAALASVRFEGHGMLGPDGTIAEPMPTLRRGLLDAMRGWLRGGRPGERLGGARAHRVWRHVQANASLWDALEDAPCLVHSDYNPGNLLVGRDDDGRWVTRGVLDWEFAWAGPNVFDIGNMLRCTPDAPAVTHTRLPGGFEGAFVEGFVEAGGVLPPQWKRTIRLLDFLNLVSFLADPAERPRMFDVVTQLIDHRLDTWNELPTD